MDYAQWRRTFREHADVQRSRVVRNMWQTRVLCDCCQEVQLYGVSCRRLAEESVEKHFYTLCPRCDLGDDV